MISPKQDIDTQIIVEKLKHPLNHTRRYVKKRYLDKGGFAKVYEFINLETSKTTAAKIFTKSSLKRTRAKQKLHSEIKIHRSLKHRNIVNFEHCFEDSSNVYILLELCANQTLNELLRRRKRLTEIEVQCYLSQLLKGLEYLHSKKIIHRDIKLSNIFLTENMELKIGDFGLAAKIEYDGEKKRTICGTPNYIAPEILEGKEGHSFGVDIWSFGVLAYTLLIGKPPFETDDIKTTYRRIRLNAYSFPDNIDISNDAKYLISAVLQTKPASRPTINEITLFRFFTQSSIPKTMPVSTLAVPPNLQLIKTYTSKERVSKTAREGLKCYEFHDLDKRPPTERKKRESIENIYTRNNEAKKVVFYSQFTRERDHSMIWVSS